MPQFALPACAAGLREVPATQLDLRPEADIIAQLSRFQPITTEKNVWAFWDRGVGALYPSYRCTVVNWVRKLGPSWTVRVVDSVEGSPNNIYKFVSRDWFPECFVNNTMDGPHRAQHAADLVRLPLLFKHGGVWMDVGNMLHTHLDALFWEALSAPDSQYEMAAWIITGQIRRQWGSFANFMLAARRGCTFIKNWHDSYKALWTGRTNSTGFHMSPLIQEIGLADGMADWFSEDKVKGMSDYVAHMLIGDRTRNLYDVTTGWDGREFFSNKVFMVEGIRNGVLAALMTNLEGQRQVELLTTRLDEPDAEKRQAAEHFIVDVMEKSHMYKVYHNSAGGIPALGDLIKKAEYLDADHRTGTFGETYRYGTVHWHPTRCVERLDPMPAEEELICATPTATAAMCRRAETPAVKHSDTTYRALC